MDLVQTPSSFFLSSCEPILPYMSYIFQNFTQAVLQIKQRRLNCGFWGRLNSHWIFTEDVSLLSILNKRVFCRGIFDITTCYVATNGNVWVLRKLPMLFVWALLVEIVWCLKIFTLWLIDSIKLVVYLFVLQQTDILLNMNRFFYRWLLTTTEYFEYSSTNTKGKSCCCHSLTQIWEYTCMIHCRNGWGKNIEFDHCLKCITNF